MEEKSLLVNSGETPPAYQPSAPNAEGKERGYLYREQQANLQAARLQAAQEASNSVTLPGAPKPTDMFKESTSETFAQFWQYYKVPSDIQQLARIRQVEWVRHNNDVGCCCCCCTLYCYDGLEEDGDCC
jgi:hypothetical protein